jgi:Glycosyl hydrolases family 18
MPLSIWLVHYLKNTAEILTKKGASERVFKMRVGTFWTVALTITVSILIEKNSAALRQGKSAVSSGHKWLTGYYVQLTAGTLPISAVPFAKYTHVIQYAVLPRYSPVSNKCEVDQASYSISSNNAHEFIRKAHANGARALVSMLNDQSAKAMRVCTDSSHVDDFVRIIVNFLNSSGYDGLDIDWEVGIINSQYERWIVKLRTAICYKVLTVAGGWNQRYLLSRIQDKINQINVGNYDSDLGTVDGRWRSDIAYNSALYQGPNKDLVTADAITYFMTWDAGIAPQKLGIGMPFFARVKRGCLAGYLSGPICKAAITGFGERYASGNALTNPRDALNYNDLIRSRYWTKGIHVWDAIHGAQYLRYETSNPTEGAFVSYTGIEQIQEAVRYVKKANLGGIMTYDLSGEYVSTKTGDARYPLSTVLSRALMASR